MSEDVGDNVDSETCPNESVPFQPQFSNLPASSSHGETYPQGTMANVYAPGPAPTVYPPASTPMQSPMMVSHGRDFNQTRAGNFQLEDPGKVFHASQGSWQPGLGTDPGHPSAGIPPPPSGMAPQGELRPEFHPSLESGVPQDPHEGNLPA